MMFAYRSNLKPDEYIVEYVFMIEDTRTMFRFVQHQETFLYEADLIYTHEIELNEENDWVLRFFISRKDGEEE